MPNEKLTATLIINPKDFLIPLDQALMECSNAVFIGLASIENLIELPEFIYGEDNLTLHSPYGIELTINQRKTFYKDWLIKKGVEDLIKAVTMMLIDVCKMLKVKSELTNTKTWDEFQKLITTPEYDISTKSFPELLQLIRPHLRANLTFETEVTSINRLRRCLVHRNGYVTPKDFFKNETFLRLCWVYYKIVYIKNGSEEVVKPMMRMSDEGVVNIIQEKRIKEFKENERIEITYQLFNELIMTCFLFGQDLIGKLMIEEKK